MKLQINLTILQKFLLTCKYGLITIVPTFLTFFIFFWIWSKFDFFAGKVFELFGFSPNNHQTAWTLLGLFILWLSIFLIGYFVQTQVGGWVKNYIEDIMVKVPMYSTIKEIIGVLKGGGDKGTLIVAIKGFAPTGYMIGVLYSQKEEFLKGHYNVTIAGTPMPNSGFLTIHPETEIYVIQEANFDDYLTYLLSMGIRTLSGVLGKDPKDSIEDYDTLDVWFANRA